MLTSVIAQILYRCLKIICRRPIDRCNGACACKARLENYVKNILGIFVVYLFLNFHFEVFNLLLDFNVFFLNLCFSLHRVNLDPATNFFTDKTNNY